MGGEGGRGRGAWLPSLLRTRRGHTGASGLCGDTGEASQHEQPQVIGPHRTQPGVVLSITNNSDYVCWSALAVYALLAASVSLPIVHSLAVPLPAQQAADESASFRATASRSPAKLGE